MNIIDDNYLELLEKEIRVQESIKAAKKAYRATIDGMLEKEIRVQESLKAAKKAYRATIDGMLENEIRVQESLKAAKKAQQDAEEQLLGKEFRVQESMKSMKAARDACIAKLEKEVNNITTSRQQADALYKKLSKETDELNKMFDTITDKYAIKPKDIFEKAASLADELSDRYRTLYNEADRLNTLISDKMKEAKTYGESALVSTLGNEQTDVQKMLFSINTAKKDVSEIAITLDEYAAALDIEKRHRRRLSIIAMAAVLLFFVFGTWQYDISRTYSAGEYGLGLVIAKDANEIQSLIEAKDYDQALKLIDKELARPFNPENYPDKAQAQHDHLVEEQDLKLKKASILLMQGKKKEAKEILKALDTTEAKEILDKLFLPW